MSIIPYLTEVGILDCHDEDINFKFAGNLKEYHSIRDKLHKSNELTVTYITKIYEIGDMYEFLFKLKKNGGK